MLEVACAPDAGLHEGSVALALASITGRFAPASWCTMRGKLVNFPLSFILVPAQLFYAARMLRNFRRTFRR